MELLLMVFLIPVQLALGLVFDFLVVAVTVILQAIAPAWMVRAFHRRPRPAAPATPPPEPPPPAPGDPVFIVHRGRPRTWLNHGWPLSVVAGFAVGLMSMDLVPTRLSLGTTGAVILWCLVATVMGLTMQVVEHRRQADRAELGAAFVSGALMAVGYLGIRLLLPAAPEPWAFSG